LALVSFETHWLMELAEALGLPLKSTCCSGAPYPPESTERNCAWNVLPFCPQSEFAIKS
jgi:hypothetical protein